MFRIVLFILSTFFLSAQFALNHKADDTTSDNTFYDTKATVTWNDSIYKKIKELEGAVYIKNLKLRRKLLSLVGSEITEEEFAKLKKEIEDNHQYRSEIKVVVYPLTESDLRIEISPRDRRFRLKKKHSNWNKDWEDEWDDFDFDTDYANEETLGVTYALNDFMFNLRESENDGFAIGYSGESEHNFYRGLFGIRYSMMFSEDALLRLGSGLYSQGIFQFDWSKGEDGNEATMSNGRLNPNVQVNPQHIIGMQLPQLSIVHAEFLSDHHMLRANLGFMKSDPLFGDSLALDNKEANINSYGFSYSLQYLDNKRFPMNGVYSNFMYQYNELRNPEKNRPYQLGNRYRLDGYSTGNYNLSYYAGLTAMYEHLKGAAIQVNSQYVYQKYNQSNYDGSFKQSLSSISLLDNELTFSMFSIGLRQKLGSKSLLLISYGQKHGKQTGFQEADWKSNFIEAMYHSLGFHFKYTYVFNNDINDNGLSYINRFYKNEGAYFSIGISFGSLF
jgi:hypothetical protein